MQGSTRWILLSIAYTLACTDASKLLCQQSVSAEVGETVILPCVTEPQLNAIDGRVEWLYNNTHDVHLRRKGKDDFSHQVSVFKGRTSIFHDELSKGNCSLKLLTVKESDSGTYWCSVRIEEEDHCTINLTVRPRGENASHGNQAQHPATSPTKQPAGLRKGNTTSNGTRSTEKPGLSQAIYISLVVVGGGIVLFIVCVLVNPKSRRFICEKLKGGRTKKEVSGNENGLLMDRTCNVPADRNLPADSSV